MKKVVAANHHSSHTVPTVTEHLNLEHNETAPVFPQRGATYENDTCPTCLYVGVTTCMGLAAYFAHMAMELPNNKSMKNLAPPKPWRFHKPFLITMSVGWLGLGAYRLYLG